MISEGHPFPIDQITVNRATRIRREVMPAAIESLANSIRERGLINPITITREGVLVAGETRLSACRSLGWDKISVRFSDETDERGHRIIELEENIKRSDLDWRDKVRAMKELHETYSAEDATWTVEKTAEAIGVSDETVYNYVRVAQSLSDPYIAKQPQYKTAKNAVIRRDQRAQQDQLQVLNENWPQAEAAVLNEDFLKWAPEYSGPKFNFIHCDFPYGIGRDKSAQGGQVGQETGKYEDSLETYKNLLSCLEVYQQALVADSAHLMFWFSMNYYQYTLTILQQMGWTIDPFPLIWFRSDNSGILPDASRGTRRVYETAFFGYRGDRKVIKPVANLFPCATEGGHASVKPEGMLKHFFQMVVDENTRMLDPTCGSGSAVRACESMGGKAVGLEVNEDFAKRANFAIMQAREGRRKT